MIISLIRLLANSYNDLLHAQPYSQSKETNITENLKHFQAHLFEILF